jgi:hypothetical protein
MAGAPPNLMKNRSTAKMPRRSTGRSVLLMRRERQGAGFSTECHMARPATEGNEKPAGGERMGASRRVFQPRDCANSETDPETPRKCSLARDPG